MRYCIQPATSADIAFLALAMDQTAASREGAEPEKDEAMGADRLLSTCVSSTQVWAAHDMQGVPCALWGVAPKADDIETGCIWLLAGQQFEQTPSDFRTLSSLVLGEMLSEYPRLENLIDVRKERAVELLRSIGFTVDPAATHAASGKVCHRAWIEAGEDDQPVYRVLQ